MLIPAFVMTLLIGALPAWAAPNTDPQWYSRQSTWQETVRVSREALAKHLAKTPGTVVPGAPGGARFSPWQAIGPFRAPSGKDGFEFAYPPEKEIDFSSLS